MLSSVTQKTIILPKDIITYIYKLKDESPRSSLRSNINGWQSTQYQSLNNIKWAEPLVNECLEALNFTHLSIKHIWFNINPNGAYHNWHCHGGAEQVGVCYIQVPNNSGNIEFKEYNQTTFIQPFNGLVLGFPAGLNHRVLTNESDQERITMAFNLHNKN